MMTSVDSNNDNVTDPTPLLWDQEGTSGTTEGGGRGDDDVQSPHVLLFEPNEEQLVTQVPTTKKLWGDVKRRLWQFRYPLTVVVANVVSFVISQGLRSDMYREYRHYYYGGRSDAYGILQYKAMIRTSLIISLLTFAYDAYICFQGAQKYDQKSKQQEQQQQQEYHSVSLDNNNTEVPSPRTGGGIGGNGNASTTSTSGEVDVDDTKDDFDYLKVSQSVDSICGRADGGGTRSSTSTTSLVCLLFAFWSLAVWQCCQDFTSLMQVQFMASTDIGEKGRCFIGNMFDGDYSYFNDRDQNSLGHLRNEPNFTKLPSDVQKWIKQLPLDDNGHVVFVGGGDGGSDVGIPAFNQSLSYLQLTNGDLVFSKATGDRYFSRRSSTANKDPGIVVYSSESKSFTEHHPPPKSPSQKFWGSRYGEVELIGFPAGPPYSAYCGIFREGGNNILEFGVMCYNSKNKKLQRFGAVVDPGKSWNGWSGAEYEYYVSGDTLWMASKRDFHRARNTKEITRLSLVSYNVDSMKKHVALSLEVTDAESHQRSNVTLNTSCAVYLWTSTAVSILVLSVLSVYLYRLDIPSCTVPASSVLALTISYLLHPAAAGGVMLGVAIGCLYCLVGVRRSNVLWKYLSTTMLIWALYSSQLAASWVFWLPSFTDYDFFENEVFFSLLPFPLLSFVVAAATNVILNHPFLQVLAVGLATLSAFSVLFALMGPNFLLIPLGLLALALGCFRAGSLFQMYRVHIIVHARRMFSSCLAFGRKAVHRNP